MKLSHKYKTDLLTWKRKEHYSFFKNFEQPFFGTTININCTNAYTYCKTYKIPFYTYYLYQSLVAVNSVKEFKYRIENDEVFEYETISGSVTVLRKDETFNFVYFDYQANFSEFKKGLQTAVEEGKNSTGLNLQPVTNLIHYSILTGIPFNGLQHAQSLSGQDSIPKIVFGQYEIKDGQVFLPVAIHVHHALCDGFHVARFIEIFKRQLEINP